MFPFSPYTIFDILGVPYNTTDSDTWLDTGKAIRIATNCGRLCAMVITRYSCYVMLVSVYAGTINTGQSLKAKLSGSDLGFYYVTNGSKCDLYITSSTSTDCVVVPFWNTPQGTFELTPVNALPSGAVAF